MFDKRELDSFLSVAHHLNFTLAADELAMSQSTLSRAIGRLEHRLGFDLFERSTRRVVLTDAGVVLQDQCKNIDIQLQRAVNRATTVAQGTAGSIKIGYSEFPINTYLPFILKDFHGQFPNIIIDLDRLTSVEQIDALERGEIDAAFLSLKPDMPNIDFIFMSEHPVVLVLRHDHPLAQKKSVASADLKSEQLILGKPRKWQPMRSAIHGITERGGLRSNPIYYAMDFASISALIGAGLGVGFFIEPKKHMKRQDIVTRPISDCDDAIPIYFAWRKDDQYPALQNFIDFTSTYIASNFSRDDAP